MTLSKSSAAGGARGDLMFPTGLMPVCCCRMRGTIVRAALSYSVSILLRFCMSLLACQSACGCTVSPRFARLLLVRAMPWMPRHSLCAPLIGTVVASRCKTSGYCSKRAVVARHDSAVRECLLLHRAVPASIRSSEAGVAHHHLACCTLQGSLDHMELIPLVRSWGLADSM